MSGIFVGIDWGCQHHQTCVVKGTGERRLELRTAHDRAGLERLGDTLAGFGPALPIALERAEGLLVEQLLALGHRIYPVNPRLAARLRERYRVAPAKDDAFDAYTLADALRHEHDHWRPLLAASAELAELRALVRDRERIVAEQVRVEAQLRAILECYHPAAARLFSSVDRQITLAFIRDYPTAEQAARLGMVRMQRFLERHGYRGRVPAAELLARLHAQLVSGAPGTTAGKSRSALAFADLLELLNAKRDELDRAVAAALARHPTPASSSASQASRPRPRPPCSQRSARTAGAFLSRRCCSRRLGSRRSPAARAPAAASASGWPPTITCATPSPGGRSTRSKARPWAPTRYDAARGRGQRSYRALRGVGACWARVLWRCSQDSTLYEPKRHGRDTAA